MKAQCVMCGRDIAQGIVCDKCDRPKRAATKGSAAAALQPEHHALAEPEPEPAAPPVPHDPFPKAPVVPFPVESTSLALTSVVELLVATGVPGLLLGPDRNVKFISDGARELLAVSKADNLTTRDLEMRLGCAVPDPVSSQQQLLNINDQQVRLTAIPLAGGSNGSVIVLRPTRADEAIDTAVLAFISETLVAPLQALGAALTAAIAKGKKDPLVQDAVNTIDQILTSLELSPQLEGILAKPSLPDLAQVLRDTAARFQDAASEKGIKIQIDAPATEETLVAWKDLSRVMGELLQNSLHYVPHGGQIVLGLRFLEHKGRPLLLFFVMDNGAVVPEEYRESIFNPGFIWDPNDSVRTGNNLARCRAFALSQGGQIWVESKTGKACTFFVRVRPDSDRS